LSYCSHKVCLTSTYNKYIISSPNRIEWAVRGLSFGCQSQLLALASEDPYIEIAKVDTGIEFFFFKKILFLKIMNIFLGERVHALKCDAQTLAVAWHPKASVLAYVQDDDSGSVRLFGILD
jgi:THO complex subunit 3